MAVIVDSKRFTLVEMEAGTEPEAWIAGLTITTWRGLAQSQVGSGTILLTIVYE